MAIAARRGKKVAVVAMTRRLAEILYAMRRDRLRAATPEALPRTAAPTPAPAER